MNETTENHWLSRLIIGIGVVGVLAVLVGCMIAPLFGPWFRQRKIMEYAIYSDCESRVDTEMVGVYVILWIIAIAAWAIVIVCNI